MIRPIDIRLNAAHPELPLAEAVTFTGSPSTVLIRGVPPNCGRWAITAVFVAASFPDGSTTTRAAVQSANGVWVATLPATATSGRTANGIRVMADGIDENGEAVTGYILGVADFAVASLDVTPAPEPGGIAYALRYFDTLPDPARKGDVIRVNGDLKFYNGTAWQPFTDLSNYYTAEQVDEAIDKLAAYYITADAQGNPFATHAALVNATTYYSGGSVRTPTRNDYAVVSADETHGGAEWRYIYAVDAQGVGQWEPQYAVEGVIAYDNTVTRTSANGVKSSGIWSAIWGALSALPTGFTSLYDWCVSQLAGKFDKSGGTVAGSNDDQMGIVFGRENGYPFMMVTDGYYYFIGFSGSTMSIVTQDGTFSLPSSSGNLALAAASPTAGNLAALDASGNPTDSTIPAANVAVKGNIPYSLGTPTVIDEASLETVEGETVYYGAATLANRTANIVQVTAATALDELRITFPAATSGKVRDFGLRVEIGTGSAALSAPSLVPIAPTGETIKIENADRAIPELADGTATAKGVTLLYFSETAPGVFVVKGEQVEEVA